MSDLTCKIALSLLIGARIIEVLSRLDILGLSDRLLRRRNHNPLGSLGILPLGRVGGYPASVVFGADLTHRSGSKFVRFDQTAFLLRKCL